MSQPPVAAVQKVRGDIAPDRLYVLVKDVSTNTCRSLAEQAAAQAQALAPKLSGSGARSIKPYWGAGFFGVTWEREYLWFQNAGTKPFTMRSLAGKTIPMWIDDPTGKEARANPKAKTRITVSGKKQVLIFRRVGKIGARKTSVRRRPDGSMVVRDVPQSYPGAPGRIAYRSTHEYPPNASTGKIAGRSRLVTRSNIGVRWRHPGLSGRRFLEQAIHLTCRSYNLGTPPIYATYRRR